MQGKCVFGQGVIRGQRACIHADPVVPRRHVVHFKVACILRDDRPPALAVIQYQMDVGQAFGIGLPLAFKMQIVEHASGKARKIEVNQAFGKKIADPKLQKLLNTGDLKYMREVFGMEEGEAVKNADDNSTEYPYDSRGFRFVQFKVGGKTLNALRFTEIKKAT